MQPTPQDRPRCPKCNSPDLAPYRNTDATWRWFAAHTPGAERAVVCMDCSNVSWPGSDGSGFDEAEMDNP